MLTKLDGTAKGGIVLAIARKLGPADPVHRRRRAAGRFRRVRRAGVRRGAGAGCRIGDRRRRSESRHSMIVFDKVAKRYPNGREALAGATLRVDPGEMVFLTGKSGAGKSTVLKLIALLERPTRGTVLINNRNTSTMRSGQISAFRRNIGVVFQDHKLLADRPVYDNVALPLIVSDTPMREIDKRVRAALDQVGLLGKERMLPLELSVGEQQRVGIARAVVSKPPLLIADRAHGQSRSGSRPRSDAPLQAFPGSRRHRGGRHARRGSRSRARAARDRHRERSGARRDRRRPAFAWLPPDEPRIVRNAPRAGVHRRARTTRAQSAGVHPHAAGDRRCARTADEPEAARHERARGYRATSRTRSTCRSTSRPARRSRRPSSSRRTRAHATELPMSSSSPQTKRSTSSEPTRALAPRSRRWSRTRCLTCCTSIRRLTRASPAALEQLKQYFAAWPEVELVQIDSEWVMRFNAILDVMRKVLLIRRGAAGARRAGRGGQHDPARDSQSSRGNRDHQARRRLQRIRAPALPLHRNAVRPRRRPARVGRHRHHGAGVVDACRDARAALRQPLHACRAGARRHRDPAGRRCCARLARRVDLSEPASAKHRAARLGVIHLAFAQSSAEGVIREHGVAEDERQQYRDADEDELLRFR